MTTGQHNIRIAISFLIAIVFTGVVGFMLIEDFTLVEAFYMTIITVSTVGFREVHALSQTGQVFTSFLIIFSFGLFAYALTTLTRFMFDGKFRELYYERKMRQRIRQKNNHVIVIGYGRTGKRASQELQKRNTPFVVIEKLPERIDEIRLNKNIPYIIEHTTIDDSLLQAGIHKAKAVISTLPNDALNLMCIITARKMNPEVRIISRALNENSDIKLRRAGANNVIMSDRMGGSRMAKRIILPTALEFIDQLLDDKLDVHLQQVSCADLNKCFLEKSIKELNVRQVSGANIIGMKKSDGRIIFNPGADDIVECSDRIFALGTYAQLWQLKEYLFFQKGNTEKKE